MAGPESVAPEASPGVAAWKEKVLEFQTPSRGRAVWQLVDTLGLYALLWFLTYRSLAVSYWLALALAILAVNARRDLTHFRPSGIDPPRGDYRRDDLGLVVVAAPFVVGSRATAPGKSPAWRFSRRR